MRNVLGFIGGALILVSSAAHSIGGWQAIGAELAKTNAPFGVLALTREPFAALFIVPGLVLAAASWGRR